AGSHGCTINGDSCFVLCDGASWTVDLNSVAARRSSVLRGESYTFTVVATNAIGDSEASLASDEVTVAALAPAAPAKPEITLDARTATNTCAAQAPEESLITHYPETSTNGAESKTVNPNT